MFGEEDVTDGCSLMLSVRKGYHFPAIDATALSRENSICRTKMNETANRDTGNELPVINVKLLVQRTYKIC